jgi:Tol biopolymer transport system component
MRLHTRLGIYILTALVLSVLTFMAGCSGGDSSIVFQNVSERAAWGTQNRVAFTSWGGNELRYIYSIGETGAGLKLLTWSDNDDDWADEGGKHPAYRADGQVIAMSARRGTNEGIYTMDATDGDRTTAATLVTKPPNDGADAMPSWSPDSQTIVFVTTQDTADMQLATVAADGTGRAILRAEPGVDLLWPVYTLDGSMILYERREQGTNQSDIWAYDVAAATFHEVLATPFDEGSPAPGPTEIPGGAPVVLFHSDRNGATYDLFAMDLDVANLPLDENDVRPVTQTLRSDGYPMWSPDGTHVGFVRDRELWTMVWTDVEADRDYRRLTRRYQ